MRLHKPFGDVACAAKGRGPAGWSCFFALLLQVACGSGTDVIKDTAEARCAYFDTLFVTSEGISLLSEDCGTLRLREPEALGDGDFDLEWYTDGLSVFPAVRALSEGARLDGVRLVGELQIEGRAPLRLRGLPRHSGVVDGQVVDQLRGVGLFERRGASALLLGALSANTSSFRLSTKPGGALEAKWVTGTEGRVLSEGEVFYLDPITAAYGPDAGSLWSAHVDRVASGSLVSADRVISASGWLGVAPPQERWDAWIADVSASEMPPDHERVAVWVGEQDGGWTLDALQGAVEEGLGERVAEARASGIRIGLRWSAFTTMPEDAAGEGWLTDPSGALLLVDGFAVADLTSEAGRQRMTDGAQAVAELGVDWLEVDRLWAAAVDGGRTRSVTPQEAYGDAMALLRDALPDAVIVGEAAPILESVGEIHGLRWSAMEPFDDVQQQLALGSTHGAWWSTLSAPLFESVESTWTARGAFAAWAATDGGLWFGRSGEAGSFDVDARYLEWASSRPRAVRVFSEGPAEGTAVARSDATLLYLNGTSDSQEFPSADGEEYWSGDSPRPTGDIVGALDGQVWVVSAEEFR